MAERKKATKQRRREKKNVPSGHVHIQATFNNTIITITDPTGAVISWGSAGTAGFKGSLKSTPYAASLSADGAARRAMERFSPLTVNWTTLALSLIPQLPLLFFDQRAQLSGFRGVPASGWLAVAYLIFFATALGQQAWLYGVKGIGPSRAGIFVNLIPVSALALSALVLGEPIGARKVIGIVLILAGVWLVNYQSQRWR